MCMFSFSNLNTQGKAYQRGIKKFECGACPECLQKKSRMWALRCSMEAKNNVGMMITLTYDTFIYNSRGEIIGENLNLDNPLSKKDVQNFIKRLRDKFKDKEIKYLACAERGKRTNRPHYHLLIFGLVFDDLVFHKKSKRGNNIYRSKTLEKIWHGGREKKGGICTVDCVNPNAQVARYCTKYCAKDSGVDDTFMLFSRGIGEEELLKRFNGKNYWIDGREYPIPRLIWQKFIENKYHLKGYSRYVAPPPPFTDTLVDKFAEHVSVLSRVRHAKQYYDNMKRWDRQLVRREIYQNFRDNDYLYKRYIRYWQAKNELVEKYRLSAFDRIRALPDDKYRTYKNKALAALIKRRKMIPYIPPRSKSLAMYKYLSNNEKHLPPLSRHYTANDSFFEKIVAISIPETKKIKEIEQISIIV